MVEFEQYYRRELKDQKVREGGREEVEYRNVKQLKKMEL